MSYHNPAAFTRNFIKISQQCSSCWYREILSPVRARNVLPDGFSPNSFNHRGVLIPWAIKKLFKYSRQSNLYSQDEKCNLLDWGYLSNKYLLFMVCLTINIEQQVYEVHQRKNPIVVDTSLDYFGKTSFKTKQNMFFPGSENPLATLVTQVVFIDPATHRPALPPNWWREKFAQYIQGSTPLRLERVQVPDNVELAKEEYTVQYDDFDAFCHMCSTNLMRICLETYAQWHLKANQLHKDVRQVNLFRNPKMISHNFFGEAAVGDVLTVNFWTDVERENVVHFIGSKKSHVIFDTVCEFHPE